jgi:hypothetical protein
MLSTIISIDGIPVYAASTLTLLKIPRTGTCSIKGCYSYRYMLPKGTGTLIFIPTSKARNQIVRVVYVLLYVHVYLQYILEDKRIHQP